MRPVVTRLIGLGLVAAFVVAASAQEKIKLGQVLILTNLGPPDGVRRAGRHFIADRGSRKGEQMMVSAAAKRPSSGPHDTIYELLGPSTVGALPDVDVLGIHHVKVRPDRLDRFEQFIVEKIHPVVGNLRPDLRVLYYRRASAKEAGEYIALFALTRESRDKYWPKGADSDELKAAFSPAVRALTKELSSYLVEGSYAADPKLAAAVFESRDWTDYVLATTRNHDD